MAAVEIDRGHAAILAEQLHHIGRQRRTKPKVARLIERMRQIERVGMQHHTWRASCGARAAVKKVASDRSPQLSERDTHLMLAALLWQDADQAKATAARQDLDLAGRELTTLGDDFHALCFALATAAQRVLDARPTHGRHGRRQRQIELEDAALREGGAETAGGFFAAAHDEHAAGIAVEPVDQANRVGGMTSRDVAFARPSEDTARAITTDQPSGRLVEHEDVLVLKQDGGSRIWRGV